MITEMDCISTNSNARKVESYLERFDSWCLQKTELDEKKTLAFFLHFIGIKSYDLVKNLAFQESPISCSYPTLKKILLQHFKPVNFLAVERAKFNVLIRLESQSIRHFVSQLQTQAARCEYGVQLEDQLRDRSIVSINLPEL
ncbi:hypothetical protein PHET_07078 [Paragonimus heterotremus]|uniref:Uncharacterized protein n=1 Tax=Paragonimus heterotremus TaxID=100268 RepID=A0A8J4SVP9_9TREM|nr:hypothetical protein PHET_07078 [Paragonimus heterotremus]